MHDKDFRRKSRHRASWMRLSQGRRGFRRRRHSPGWRRSRDPRRPQVTHATVIGIAAYRVHERLADVEIEHVSEFVGLRVLLALPALAVTGHRMVSEAVVTQPREQS